MAKVLKSEVENVPIVANSILENEEGESSQLKSEISSLENISSQKIDSEIWDSIKARLSFFENLQVLRAKTAVALIDAITSASSIMADYMGPDEALDDSLIPELQLRLEELQRQIDALSARIAECRKVNATPHYNSKGEIYYTITYPEGYISSLEASKRELEEMYRIVKEKKEKLEQLAPKDNAAYSILQGIEATINMYKEQVNLIPSINLLGDPRCNPNIRYKYNLQNDLYNIDSQINAPLTKEELNEARAIGINGKEEVKSQFRMPLYKIKSEYEDNLHYVNETLYNMKNNIKNKNIYFN